MKPRWIALAALLAATAAQAGNDPYGNNLGAYKAELKHDGPDLTGSGFASTVAISQAKRAVLEANVGDVTVSDSQAQTGNGNAGPAPREPRAASGSAGVSVASPQIFAPVHGNVTVVMQRGAVRGSITSVKR